MKKTARNGRVHADRGRVKEILKYYEPVVDCVADLFGPTCEVVLHDVANPAHSVIKIRNGHVTGRTIGSPLTDLGFEILRKRNFNRTTLGNYQTHTTNGRTLNSNAVMIRNEGGKIVGMLCVNWDVTPFLAMQKALGAAYRNGSRHSERSKPDFHEHHASDVPTLIRNIIEKAVKRNRRNGERKEQRLRIVNDLYHRGIFNTRGAVKQVANALGVSNVCVYKYLEEVRH